MQKFFAIFILLSVLAIGVFGFALMNHTGDHYAGCISSQIANVPCPENVVAMSLHHIQAYNSFFSVVTSVPFTFTILLLIVLILCSAFVISSRSGNSEKYHFRQRKREVKSIPVLRKIMHWLSLFELSPPPLIVGVGK